jgi:hypothetical protein
MIQTLPFELLENIIFYLNYQDVYSLSKVDIRASEILLKTCCWIIKLPKPIDWSSPNAPKKYRPYDQTDFTIHYQDAIFRRGQGVSFTSNVIGGRSCLVSNHLTPIILYRDYLVVDNSLSKITPFFQVGKTKLPISYREITYIVSNWVVPNMRGTRGCDNGQRGERGPVGLRIRHPRIRQIKPENRWRSTENDYNIRIRGKKYETDFSLEFETDPGVLDYSENDE